MKCAECERLIAEAKSAAISHGVEKDDQKKSYLADRMDKAFGRLQQHMETHEANRGNT